MPEYRYSPMETAILSVFRAAKPGRRYSTTDLMEKVYNRRTPPMNARQSIMSVIGVLIKKVDANREPFRIERTLGRGPVPHEFWKEARR